MAEKKVAPAGRHPAEQTIDRHPTKKGVAVMVTGADGSIAAQNPRAEKLVGEAAGRKCWELMDQVRGTRDLPCVEGCTNRQVDAGLEGASSTTIGVRGDAYELSCVAVGDQVVCTMVPRDEIEPALGQPLSPRERDVLFLLAEGLTSADIAARMGIRESTVRVHVERMRKKLGQKTRAGLVAHGFRTNLLRL